MVTYFNRKDLVSFGSYLLSEKRKASFQNAYEESIKVGFKDMPPEEAAGMVWNNDVENWLEEQRIIKDAKG